MEKKVIEEVVIKRKKEGINKERLSERIKNELLSKKKKRQEAESYMTAQKVVKDYREKQKSHSTFKRKAHTQKVVENFFDKTREGAALIVIRISGSSDRISKEIFNILTKLKLKKLYAAIIMKYDKETFQLLNLIEAYITWGFVNKKEISEIVHKRGSYHSQTGEAVQIDNEIIENNLGKFNVLCLEDIVHELATNGAHFNDVMNFLGFFLLSPTEEIKEQVNIKFFRGGQQGFRGDKINELLKKMV